MEKIISRLQERLESLNQQSHAITQKAEKENRDLTPEEAEQLKTCLADFEGAKVQLEEARKLKSQQDKQTLAIVTPEDRKTQPNRVDDGTVKVGPDNVTKDPKLGFAHFGEYAHTVKLAATRDGEAYERLAAASTIGTEGVGADGGFAVPPEFRNEIMVKVLGEESLLSRCDQVSVTGNALTVPTDGTTPWQTSGGILSYWDGETVAATQSKPSLQQTTIKLNKLRTLVPMSEKLLEDAAAMDSYLRRKAPEKMQFKVNHAILQGTGVGQPLGILNAPALISIAKESSQVANTLVPANVTKMYARLLASSRASAVWVCHQDVETELWNFARPGRDATGAATSNFGSEVGHIVSYSPDGKVRLFGKPVVFTQACETLGDKGDVFLVDFRQYLCALKSGPNPRTKTSMHLWFDQDLVAFKFVLRIGGQPWWSSSVSARDGSNTYSPYVTLDARA